MKTAIQFCLLILVSTSLSAKEINRQVPDVFYFVAEDVPYYQVANLVPASDLEFYSAIGGGHMIGKMIVGANGCQVQKGSKDFTPSFVLSVKYKNSAGITGSGMVSQVGDKKLIFLKPDAYQAGTTATLSWKAATSVDDITFTILKSTDGNNYKPIGVVPAHSSSGLETYSYTDNSANNFGFFKIQISNKNGLLYTSRIVSLGNKPIVVYPTVATTLVSVVVPTITENATRYRIFDDYGKTVQSGYLHQSQSVLNVESLMVGSYYIAVGEKQFAVAKFIKR